MVDLWLTLALSGSLWLAVRLTLALSGSLWLAFLLSLAPSCSLKLPICLQSPRLAHKALAQLAAALLRCNTLCWSGQAGGQHAENCIFLEIQDIFIDLNISTKEVPDMINSGLERSDHLARA